MSKPQDLKLAIQAPRIKDRLKQKTHWLETGGW